MTITPLTLNMEPVIRLTHEQFYQLCQANPELKLELTASGELIVMPPTGGETGRSNLGVGAQLWFWNKRTNLGVAFASSTGFTLPNGAERSPDAAWIKQSRWQALSSDQREKFIPLCPDFVIEILSPSDRLSQLRTKMQEYTGNGCQLGWLLNRKRREIEVFQTGQPAEVLISPKTISADPILPGFTLDLDDIWG